MSLAVLCDQCDSMLRVDGRGDDEYGERSAWITIGLAGESFEVCTTTCAIQFLQRDEVIEGIADRLEVIAGIARTIREHEGESDQ